MASEEKSTENEAAESKNTSDDEEIGTDNFYSDLKQAMEKHIIFREQFLSQVLELKVKSHDTVTDLCLLKTPEMETNLLKIDTLLESHKNYLASISSCENSEHLESVEEAKV